MAYRKTELVLAHIEAQKAAIIAAAIDILRKEGYAAMTSTAIVARTGMSMGKVFHHFADMAELCAQVEATIQTRDIEAVVSAAKGQGDHPIRSLTAALLNLLIRLSDRASREMMIHGESYRTSLERQLAHVIGPCLVDKSEARIVSPAVLGAIFAMAGKDSQPQRRVSMTVLFVLAGLGIANATAQRALDAVDRVP